MKRTILIICFLLMFSASAIAKEGFYLGAYIPVNMISGTSSNAFSQTYFDNLDLGVGYGIRGGYGFNNYIAFQVGYAHTDHKNKMGLVAQEFRSITADIRFSVSATKRLEPYILIGGGHYEIGDDSGSFKGWGYHAGIGMSFYVISAISVDIDAAYKIINLDSNSLGVSGYVKAKITSFGLGMTYHF